jgi:hypothetical protein
MFEHWEPAEAKVISREFTWNSPAHSKPQYKYVVEVQAPGGEPFRGEVHDPYLRDPGYRGAYIGETVAVHADFKARKVKLDTDDPARHSDWQAGARNAKSKYEAALAGAPGSEDESQITGKLAGATEGRESSHEAASAIPAPDTANELAKLADLKDERSSHGRRVRGREAEAAWPLTGPRQTCRRGSGRFARDARVEAI